MTQAPRMADDLASPEGVPPDDDAALIAESCRVPDRSGAVFDRHAVAIHGYIARRLGPDAADDLVAEAFLVAFRKRADYDLGQPSARPWLYGIATRLISRHHRDEVRFFRAIAKTGIDPAAGRGGDPVAEGLRYEEAARALRIPAGTLSSRVARARRQLQQALGGVGSTDGKGGHDHG